MATLIHSLAAVTSQDEQIAMSNPVPDKISAYYSLVFPNFTYYIQTLNVIIGRRCIPASAASSSDNPQVDVDLGSLKSVSRLHAKIEYEEEEERFVLHVFGRNGAWVDGVWSGSGSKVPLGDRSQIQIASRTFHFVLPPTPDGPEDSSTPSSPSSSANRPRSPSVDITSFSPPSSIPSCSPPPVRVAPLPPKIPPLPETQPQLPNSNSINRVKTNPKKRKKSDVDAPPLPRPEVIPPKPQLTYAQMCYRAIKGLSGRGSLQDICHWIQENFEYYKYSDKDWESSVRHNLSSNRAFKKAERGPDERGKGALWTLDPQYEHTFEEQEAKRQTLAALGTSGTKDAKAPGKKGKSGLPLDPPFRRTALKGGPLPPPLTSAPLIPKTSLNATTLHSSTSLPPSVPTIKSEPTNSSISPSPYPPVASLSTTAASTPAPPASSGSTIPAPQPSASSSTHTPAAFPPIPASVRIPIIIGPAPSSNTGEQTASPKPIVLQDNTLILNPQIFSHLTPKHLQELEALGAQKALEILQGYIVNFYKEKLRAEGARGRGRGKPKRGRGAPGSTRGAAPGTGRGEGASTGLFTTSPLPPRTIQPYQPQLPTPAASPPAPTYSAMKEPPMASLQPQPLHHNEDTDDVIVVDDDPSDDARVSKKMRLDTPDLSSSSAIR
ncbi:unnamed protein product [Somion occarium]|uniref:Uncharacterized protein n=1 Tax=Somion occarium TaxID=3059160 RepID=A0ABP1D170_9APHY